MLLKQATFTVTGLYHVPLSSFLFFLPEGSVYVQQKGSSSHSLDVAV